MDHLPGICLQLKYLPPDANEWEVMRAIAAILHSEEFNPRKTEDERVINFQVKLNRKDNMGTRNDGTGILTLPTVEVGDKFVSWVRQKPFKMARGKVLVHYIKGFENTPPPWLSLTLQRTPYINPDVEEEYAEKLDSLDEELRIDAIQCGTLYYSQYPRPGDKPRSRSYSIEWEQGYVSTSAAWLGFEYNHKLIRIELGNKMTESSGYTIAIKFSNISKIAVGYDGNPYVIFDTIVPPIFETIQFNRPMTGDRKKDFRKYRQRVGFIDERHEFIAPYAKTLRVILYNDPGKEMISYFSSMCMKAGISSGTIVPLRYPYLIEAASQGFFTQKILWKIQKEIGKFPWPIAFQLELFLRNNLLTTAELVDLLPSIWQRCEKFPSNHVGLLLRALSTDFKLRPLPLKHPKNRLDDVERDANSFKESKLTEENILCYHVTFTPTRTLLEGPYATQSNRVLRLYQEHSDNFLRVEFRDEDSMQFRWDREVDGSSFLIDRVGGILKNGFSLADRHFEFLAYSSSALREHSVWFMHSFIDGRNGRVTAQSIRDNLGIFAGTELVKQPSKYAARLAQAFTATNSSIRIKRSEWKVIDDIFSRFAVQNMNMKTGKRKPQAVVFTDGIGVISQRLSNRMWKKICDSRHGGARNCVQPSAYQIRFLGFKGVVSVDCHLDEEYPDGEIMMCLRPSMKKFATRQKDEEEAEIEIARSFERPNTTYLNRALIMILEDAKVSVDEFMELQSAAVAEARTIDESLEKFYSILESHSLGKSYQLSSTLRKLKDLGLDISTKDSVDNPFFQQLREIAVTEVLREIKHNARIPIPDSYKLVGVVDEGTAWVESGRHNVFTLKEGEICACVQQSTNKEPEWLQGTCTISRSPVCHPGDVQRVFAKKPPPNMLCAFSGLKNVVVFPSVGKRPLPSMLSGGDLDGDEYDVIKVPSLLPTIETKAASYSSAGTFELERDATVDDICDFIVEYINSDVLGLLSDRLLTIADQSIYGIADPDCIWLAELCSQAVDYPKQGVAVNIDDDRLPRTLIRCKPDWHAAEVVSPRQTDYYRSSRALGYLFRSIEITDPSIVVAKLKARQAETWIANGKGEDIISLTLKQIIQTRIEVGPPQSEELSTVRQTFKRYAEELQYICFTHTLTNESGVKLLESEVVVGVILANCSQKRWRKEKVWRMRTHTQDLVGGVRNELVEKGEGETVTLLSLRRAWCAWLFSVGKPGDFGANSFGLIALGIIFELMGKLELTAATMDAEAENSDMDDDDEGEYMREL